MSTASLLIFVFCFPVSKTRLGVALLSSVNFAGSCFSGPPGARPHPWFLPRTTETLEVIEMGASTMMVVSIPVVWGWGWGWGWVQGSIRTFSLRSAVSASSSGWVWMVLLVM